MAKYEKGISFNYTLGVEDDMVAVVQASIERIELCQG